MGVSPFLFSSAILTLFVLHLKRLVLAASVAVVARHVFFSSKIVGINKAILKSERSFTNPFVQSFATPLRALVPERAPEQGVPRRSRSECWL